MKPVNVGIIGCGAISGAYIEHARSFPILQITSFADVNADAAKAKCAEAGAGRACTVSEMLSDPSVDVVLNLTVPKVHAAVSLQAIEAGKHTYGEKPLGISREEGQRIIEAAQKRKLLVGCAPDTVLGAGIQTSRKLIDDGAIGKPIGFTAFMMSFGPESWHPNPEFFYQVGGGPLFDMGPYYLTALLNLFGPVKRITGAASIAIPERTITHKDRAGGPGPKFGKKIHVETPDHICGTMEFENGVIGTIIMSFATRFNNYDWQQPITVFGTEGSMRVPDPNGFDGPVHIRQGDDPDWKPMPHTFVEGYGRAVGLADMAYAIRSGRRHRASGQQALAVLDLMQGFLESAASGLSHTPKVKYERPEPMPAKLPFGQLDQ